MAFLDETFHVILQLNALLVSCVTDIFVVLTKPSQVLSDSKCFDRVRRLCKIAILLDLIEGMGLGGVEGSKVIFGSLTVISPAFLLLILAAL